MILAGGLGTRLSSLVSDRPKALVEINRRPFLSYLFDQLESAGCRKVVLCTGYLGGAIRKKFGTRYKSLSLFYSRESVPRGTGGALRLALPLVKTKSILVMNGDSFCGASLTDFYLDYKDKKTKAAILLTRVPDARRYGKVSMDAKGRILRFLEKDSNARAGWINAGVYLLNRDLLRSIPARKVVSLEKEMFPAWIEAGLYGHRVRARFLDIGTVESYNRAGHFFSKKKQDIL